VALAQVAVDYHLHHCPPSWESRPLSAEPETRASQVGLVPMPAPA
jgi:hypothetical protein